MSIPDLRKQYDKLVADALALQTEYEGKAMPPEKGTEFETTAKAAEKLQIEIKEIEARDKKVTDMKAFMREIPEANNHLPAPAETVSKQAENAVAGYLTLGQAVTASDAYQRFQESGAPRGEWHLFRAEQLVQMKRGGPVYVALTQAERQKVEQKAIPTLGAGIIEPLRVGVVPFVTEDDRLRLRDVLTVGRTSTNAIEYVRFESYTRAATRVAETVTKPQAAMELTRQTANVLTIAVWIPATVQQLADMGQLQGLIDGRLRYDVRKEEEERIMYGAGGTTDFAGICTTAGTHDIATADNRVTSPTLIDDVRVGMTEVRVAGYEPNALAIHPIDWEKMVLMKGTDAHYLAQVFPDEEGNMRVWGLQVVETVAAEENAGAATEERNFVVGDFRRGAAFYLREDISVAVGMKGDDFIQNLRTILAEERAAFALFAPKAFAIMLTQAQTT